MDPKITMELICEFLMTEPQTRYCYEIENGEICEFLIKYGVDNYFRYLIESEDYYENIKKFIKIFIVKHQHGGRVRVYYNFRLIHFLLLFKKYIRISRLAKT
ncbi:hypothetical protein RF11_02061 [Thelohanellus kitauei]|uniref:Uncharacterized protein n=1 Tax=Thelohanellus kitauei TaxID=669202 RepID=A0A0C2MXQ8_THEKT|nr:hypothetical protein RF11_02061 [Thelohanellus kitauei]